MDTDAAALGSPGSAAAGNVPSAPVPFIHEAVAAEAEGATAAAAEADHGATAAGGGDDDLIDVAMVPVSELGSAEGVEAAAAEPVVGVGGEGVSTGEAAAAAEGPARHAPRGKGLMTWKGGVALEGEEEERAPAGEEVEAAVAGGDTADATTTATTAAATAAGGGGGDLVEQPGAGASGALRHKEAKVQPDGGGVGAGAVSIVREGGGKLVADDGAPPGWHAEESVSAGGDGVVPGTESFGYNSGRKQNIADVGVAGPDDGRIRTAMIELGGDGVVGEGVVGDVAGGPLGVGVGAGGGGVDLAAGRSDEVMAASDEENMGRELRGVDVQGGGLGSGSIIRGV